MNNINLGIYEQSDLVRDKEAKKWGDIDAMAGFDPTPAIFEEKELVRNLKVDKVVSVILFSKKYIKENPDAPVKFLKSFIKSYDFYRQNTNRADERFKQEAKLDITSNALAIASGVEPNLNAKNLNEIRLDFIEEDDRIMQEAANFLFENGMINKKVDMLKNVDLTYLQLAKKEFK